MTKGYKLYEDSFRDHLRAMRRIFEYREEMIWGPEENYIQGIFHKFYASINIIKRSYQKLYNGK